MLWITFFKNAFPLISGQFGFIIHFRKKISVINSLIIKHLRLAKNICLIVTNESNVYIWNPVCPYNQENLAHELLVNRSCVVENYSPLSLIPESHPFMR